MIVGLRPFMLQVLFSVDILKIFSHSLYYSLLSFKSVLPHFSTIPNLIILLISLANKKLKFLILCKSLEKVIKISCNC